MDLSELQGLAGTIIDNRAGDETLTSILTSSKPKTFEPSVLDYILNDIEKSVKEQGPANRYVG